MNFAFHSLCTARQARAVALLCALVPAALVGGCGGGGNHGPLISATPTPTPVAGTPLRTTSFRLPGGQIGILALSRNGNGVAGELRAFNAPGTQLLVPSGTYPVSGSFAAPNSFNVGGQVASGRNFTLAGTLPDANVGGSYNLTLGSVSYTGTLPSRSSDVIPASTPYAATGNLKFSDFVARGPVSLPQFPFDFDGVASSGAGAFNKTPSNLGNAAAINYLLRDNLILPTLRATGVRENPANRRQDLQLEIRAASDKTDSRSFFAGQTFDLAPAVGVSDFSIVSLTLNGFPYQSIGGSLVIKSVSSDAVTFELRDVKMANSNAIPVGDISDFPDDGKPLSTFIVNGTFENKGLQTQIIRQ